MKILYATGILGAAYALQEHTSVALLVLASVGAFAFARGQTCRVRMDVQDDQVTFGFQALTTASNAEVLFGSLMAYKLVRMALGLLVSICSPFLVAIGILGIGTLFTRDGYGWFIWAGVGFILTLPFAFAGLMHVLGVWDVKGFVERRYAEDRRRLKA